MKTTTAGSTTEETAVQATMTIKEIAAALANLIARGENQIIITGDRVKTPSGYSEITDMVYIPTNKIRTDVVIICKNGRIADRYISTMGGEDYRSPLNWR